MAVRSAIVAIREIDSGDSVGYGRTFEATRETKIATIPIGYGDGYPRSLSNRSQVLIRGRRCPVVGRVSMDVLTCDVTDLKDAAIGDSVTLLGEQDDDRITLSEFADWAGTSGYEVLATFGSRLPRGYLNT